MRSRIATARCFRHNFHRTDRTSRQQHTNAGAVPGRRASTVPSSHQVLIFPGQGRTIHSPHLAPRRLCRLLCCHPSWPTAAAVFPLTSLCSIIWLSYSVVTGSQRAGAGVDLVRSFPYSRDVFDEADEVLHTLEAFKAEPLSHMIWNRQQVSAAPPEEPTMRAPHNTAIGYMSYKLTSNCCSSSASLG